MATTSPPTAELADRPSGERAPAIGLTSGRFFGGGRLYLSLALLALLLAACSLLIPSTPSYDPWSWLLWGREILHLNLQTIGGPSWKPLPMILTIVFALFGGAAPDLWLVIARAGALLALAMAFKLAWRLTRDLGELASVSAPGGRVLRALRYMAPLLAGLIAAGSVINSRAFISDNALGYSEGLATALMLIAVDRHLDGRPRQAFVVGFFAALDRPELWVFWVPYGVFLMWRDAGMRKLVLALFALIPVLWFLPELWGSGHLFRNVTRALHPRSNSAAFASCPFCTEFKREAWLSLLNRVKVPGIAALIAAAFGLWRSRAWRSGSAPLDRSTRARAWLLTIGVFGFVWWLGIAIETQAGFSGNRRYLVLGTTPMAICGGAAWGWFALTVARWIRRLARRWRRRGWLSTPQYALPAGALLTAGLFLLAPPWIGANIISLPRTHGALLYQAHLREDMAAAIKRLGRGQILGCGSIMTEAFQVPMLAYMLDVHTVRIKPPPVVPGTGTPPNVIFQTRATRNTTLLPIVRAWHVNYSLVDDQRTFHVYMDCAARAAF